MISELFCLHINIFRLDAHAVSGDDMHKSVWCDTQLLPRFPELDRDTKTDVLIIGGGLAGILIAHTMEQAGVDYLLIEANEICSGISRNTTAKITSQHGLLYSKLVKRYGEAVACKYWHAQEEAVEEYRSLSQTIPCEFESKDAYLYSTDQTAPLLQELTALKQAGIPAEFIRETALPFRISGAIRFRNQAQFHPLKFVAGLAPTLNIREHTVARAFDGNAVLTDCGRIQAKNVVVTTHFPMFNKHGSYFLKMYQDRSYVLALKGALDLDGMYLDASGQGLSFRNYSQFLLVGGGSHRTGKKGSGWSEPEAFANKYYPNAPKAYYWAAQDCMTLDGIPYIGLYSKNTPGLYVATGFNKWGMTSSMVSATILCDLIQGKQNRYADVFSPSRTMMHPQLLTNAVEAASNLLTFSKLRCPHMGCALKWNAQERSWDCPCHGSRFSKEGVRLDNPATGDVNLT